MAQSFCAALQSCCAAAKYAYDPAPCLVQVEAQYAGQFDAVKRANVTFDANAAAACQKALHDREAQCNGDSGPPGVDSGFLDPVARACRGVIKGTVAAGGACDASGQCAVDDSSSSASCVVDTDPLSPTFERRLCIQFRDHVMPGNACDLTYALSAANPVHRTCEPSLGYCAPNSPGDASGTCQTFAANGETCGTKPGTGVDIPCDRNSYCDRSQGPTGNCQPAPTIGMPCSDAIQNCAHGAWCKSGTCVQSLPDGSECMAPNQCTSGSCATHYPPPDSGPNVGKCFTYPGNDDTTFTISPRTCGFGPGGDGPDDAGISGE